MAKIPGPFLASKVFLLPFGVYFGTYAAANFADTYDSVINELPAASTTATPEKFIATAVVSTGLCVYKDAKFASIFGAAANKIRPLPLTTYTLFASRDLLTVLSCFIMPPILGAKLESLPTHTKDRFPGLLTSSDVCLRTSQLVLPVALQFVSTPLHLLGLDLANRQGKVGIFGRFRSIGRDMWTATPLRIVRIVPAFGFGNVLNTGVRKSLLGR